eukprot:COSAG01_NODE_584_length_15174_cov_27.387901_14_plen_98_part_00
MSGHTQWGGGGLGHQQQRQTGEGTQNNSLRRVPRAVCGDQSHHRETYPPCWPPTAALCWRGSSLASSLRGDAQPPSAAGHTGRFNGTVSYSSVKEKS